MNAILLVLLGMAALLALGVALLIASQYHPRHRAALVTWGVLVLSIPIVTGLIGVVLVILIMLSLRGGDVKIG